MKNKLFLASILVASILLMSIALVSAIPPQSSIADQGFELRIPQVETLKQGRSVIAHMHIFNISNGVPIYPSNSDVGCVIHLYNQTGNDILEQTMEEKPNGLEWELFIDGGNLTEVGDMSFMIYCNDSSVGGFVSSSFEVTSTGFTKTLGFYFLMLILTFGVIIFGYYIEDIWVVMLGGFGLILVGLFILFNGIDIIKDPVYTWGIGIIILMLGSYFIVRGGIEQLGN